MFIRIFVTSNTDNEAKDVYRKFIDITKKFIQDEKIEKTEPYWKYDDTYVIETNVILTCNIDSHEFEEFLYQISDKWILLGNPVDNVLASVTTEGCKYIISGISMINIFF